MLGLITTSIYNREIKTEVDTGASTSFISHSLLVDIERSSGRTIERIAVNDNLHAVFGDGISKTKVLSKVKLPVEGKEVEVMVIESNKDNLIIGKDLLTKLGINIDNLFLEKLRAEEHTTEVEKKTIENKEEIEDGYLLGTMMFDEDVKLPDINEFKHLALNKEELEMLKETLEVELPDALKKRKKGKPIDVTPIVIKLDIEGAPICGKLRQYSTIQESYLNEWTLELKTLGFIVDCNESPWGHPVHVVMDENGKYRMVTDLRRLNERVHLIRFPLPNLQTIQARIKGKRWFAKLDACKGYFQVAIAPESQEMFAFTTHQGKFKPTRLPQGFKNSVSIYQQVMVEVLGEDLLKGNVLVLLDDVLLFEDTVMDLLKSLVRVVDKLSKKNLLINYKKSIWLDKEVTWCGRRLSSYGVGYDKKQLQSFIQMDYPINGDKLQRFLCGVNFFRSSLLDYARISKPLYDELLRISKLAGSRKSKSLAKYNTESTSDLQKSFTDVKELLVNTMDIGWPSDDDEVFLFSDASDLGYAVVSAYTSQDQSSVELLERQFTPCGLLSGVFKGSQCSWSVGEKEMYPIVLAAQKLWYLLHRRKGFTILTDHKDLIGILKKITNVSERNPLLDKMSRWRYILAPFEFEIQHINGSDNVFSDMLSRLVTKSSGESELSDIFNQEGPILQFIYLVNSMQDVTFNLPNVEEVRDAQLLMEEEEKSGLVKDEEDILRLKGKIYVPNKNNLRIRLLITAHSLQHNGVETTKSRIDKLFIWHGMLDDVKKFVNGCIHCKASKSNYMVNVKLGKLPKATRFGEIWHLDFFTMESAKPSKQGRYFLVAKDDFTHYVEIFDVNTTSGTVVAKSIAHIISSFGKPDMIMFDGGSHFNNKVIDNLCKSMNMKQRFSIPYVHRSHGKVERANQSILKACKTIMSELRIIKDDWLKLKDVIKYNINNTPIKSIGKSPMEILFGRNGDTILTYMSDKQQLIGEDIDVLSWNDKHKRLIEEFVKDLEDLHDSLSTGLDIEELQQNPHKLAVGDFVVYGDIVNKKSEFTWKGPYQVVGLNSPHIITLREIGEAEADKDIVAHISRVRYLEGSDLDIDISLKEQAMWLKRDYEFKQIEQIFKKDQVIKLRTKWNSLDGKFYVFEEVKLDDFQVSFPKETMKFISWNQDNAIVKEILQDWDTPSSHSIGS